MRWSVGCFAAAVAFLSMLVAPSIVLPQSDATGSSLSEKMSSKDQLETGVVRLSAAQKRALNRWIDRYVAGLGLVEGSTSAGSFDIYTKCYDAAMEAVATGKNAPLPQVCKAIVDKYERDLKESSATGSSSQPLDSRRPAAGTLSGSCSPAIDSQLDGDFEGWSGDTVFKLTNGQYWEQAEYSYFYTYSFMPEVTIYASNSGCRLKVEGEDDTVLVRKVK